MSYSLSIDGATPATLESLGFSEAVFTEDMRGASKLVLTAPQDFVDAMIIEPFQRCALFDGDGNAQFVGWLDGAPRAAGGGSQRRSYTLAGPWRWFERSNYVQGKGGLSVLAGTPDAGASAPQAFDDSLSEVVDKVTAGHFTFTGTPAAFTHETPTNFRADVSCAEAMATLLAFAPSAVVRWIYTTPASDTAAIELKILAAPNGGDWFLDLSAFDLTECNLTPRYDLLRGNVAVYFIKDNAVAGSDLYTCEGDAADLSADGTLIATYDATALNSLPAAGIAAALGAWHERLHVDGNARQEGIDWTKRAGDSIGFVGGAWGELMDYVTTIFEVQRDLFANRSEFRFGVMPAISVFKLRDFDAGRSPLSAVHNATLGTPAVPVVPDEQEPFVMDFGTAAWRKVYRCDGYFAWVLMTPWEESPE
jgi:hypothetical protein